ncbi:MAG: hypothetical protein ACYCU3_01390 [Streptosporangiaceae bacterium]
MTRVHDTRVWRVLEHHDQPASRHGGALPRLLSLLASCTSC